jgi:hypothetical protein
LTFLTKTIRNNHQGKNWWDMGYFEDRFTPSAGARGGVAVGDMAHTGWAERGAVLVLRYWFLGQGGGDMPLCGAHDTEAQLLLSTPAVMQAAHGLCTALVGHTRRPLLHHSVQCSCIGADEACFAHLVCAAGSGARDEAMAFAMMLAHPQAALLILPQAERLGLLLHRLALQSGPNAWADFTTQARH